MNIDSQVDIGNRIKAIRQSRGENQTEFAKKIKATLPAVSNWETGRNIPNNKRLKAIADIGNMSVDELLGKDTVTISKDEYNELLEIAQKYENITKEDNS